MGTCGYSTCGSHTSVEGAHEQGSSTLGQGAGLVHCLPTPADLCFCGCLRGRAGVTRHATRACGITYCLGGLLQASE